MICETLLRLKQLCLWEESLSDVLEDVVMLLRAAGVAFVTVHVCKEESVCTTVVASKLPCVWERSRLCKLCSTK